MLKGIGVDGKTALIATSGVASNVHKSARNIQGVSVIPVADLNAFEILRPDKVLFTKDALDLMKEGGVLSKTQAEAGEPAAKQE